MNNEEKDRLIVSFKEILEYIEKNKKKPSKSTIDINERQLYSRLEAIKNDPEKILLLEHLDNDGLLKESVFMDIDILFLNAIFEMKEKSTDTRTMKIELVENKNEMVILYVCIDECDEDDENDKPSISHHKISMEKSELIEKIDKVLSDTYDDVFPKEISVNTTEDIYNLRDKCSDQMKELNDS